MTDYLERMIQGGGETLARALRRVEAALEAAALAAGKRIGRRSGRAPALRWIESRRQTPADGGTRQTCGGILAADLTETRRGGKNRRPCWSS